MFGLEGRENTNEVDFSYDLEKDLADIKKQKDIKEQVEQRIGDLKTALRKGDDKEMFDKYGILLHGYVSMKKVIERCTAK